MARRGISDKIGPVLHQCHCLNLVNLYIQAICDPGSQNLSWSTERTNTNLLNINSQQIHSKLCQISRLGEYPQTVGYVLSELVFNHELCSFG